MTLIESSTLMALVGTLVGLLLVRKLIQLLTRPKLPPGPMPLPLIGNLLQLAARPEYSHVTYHKLAERYGDIYTVSIFNTKFIVLSSYEVCKDAFVKNADAFSERPMTYYLNLVYENGNGAVFHEGDIWKGIRKLTFSSLFGFSKESMESKIWEEAAALADVIAEYDGKLFDPSSFTTKAICNIICSICFGSRFEYTDERFMLLTDKLVECMRLCSLMEPIDHIPALRLLPLPKNIKKQLINLKEIDSFIQRQIEDHKDSFDKNNLRDFIDLYYIQVLEKEQDEHFSEAHNMRYIIRDLLFGGTPSSSTTLCWGLLYLLNYPEVQTRLGQEMEEVVGNHRPPSLSDRTNLNYLQAFILETLRCSSVSPLGLPHLCTADRQIGGYTIPKGATVITNMYHIHMSERYWTNPTQFDPDRFLDTKGKLVNVKDGFIPFNAGPRKCPGESLTQNHLFLLLGCLIQKFTFEPADKNNPPTLRAKMALTLNPEPFQIKAILK